MAKAVSKPKRGLPANRGGLKDKDRHYVDALSQTRSKSLGTYLKLSRIQPNPDQPRKVFEGLDELAASIAEKGILEPVLVRPEGRDYTLVAGERRYRAAKLQGLTEIPAIILEDATDKDVLEIALIENLQRRDLTPFEEADALRQLQARYQHTHETMAKKLGKARSSVTETLKLADMPRGVRSACEKAGLTRRSVLVEISKQSDQQTMLELVTSHKQGSFKRQEVRDRRRPKTPGRPKNYVYSQVLPNKAKLEIKFQKSRVDKNEIKDVLKTVLKRLSER